MQKPSQLWANECIDFRDEEFDTSGLEYSHQNFESGLCEQPLLDVGLFEHYKPSNDGNIEHAHRYPQSTDWSGPYLMSRVDWRWAAQKGFYNPQTKQWNAAAGGYPEYARQRSQHKFRRRGAETKAIQPTDAILNSGSSGFLCRTVQCERVERPIPFRTCSVTFNQVVTPIERHVFEESIFT